MADLATPRRTAPALSFAGVTYTYPGAEAPALVDVTLSLEAGEFALLAGRSASGKSTLLRAACGLVPHFHGGELGGEISVAGLDALASGPGELAGAVAYVAQDPEAQVVSTTVAAEIALPLELRGADAASRARAVEEVALALAIPHLLERTVDTLSGGELQRVALAAALVTRPRLVLLDEPTSQLDPVAGDELIWLLRRLNEEWGIAILLAEHRLERCLPAADRVVAMADGSLAFDGQPTEFLTWSQSNDPALETPAARLFSLSGIEPLPTGVRQARQTLASISPSKAGGGDALRTACTFSSSGPGDSTTAETKKLREKGVTASRPATTFSSPGPGDPTTAKTKKLREGDVPTPPPGAPTSKPVPALRIKSLRVELGERSDRHEALRGIDLQIDRGERVALMGRNGAGKSTLLRTIAGLHDPAKGKVDAPDGVALLTQNAGDYLVRERVADELPGEGGLAALRAVGMEHALERDPRDLSGGERQRLALAVVLAGRAGEGEELPGVVALDEPTRGMDRARKDELGGLAQRLADRDAAVVIATHDVEFAARFADRVVLLGDGVAIADGPAADVLSGGWYFATEVARVLDLPGVVTAEDGAAALLGRS